MAITIRQAKPDDYVHVIARLDDWWGGRHMAAMLPRLFFQHFRPWAFVAECNGALAGFLVAFRSQTEERHVYCHFIGVDPTARGQGVGEALYQRLFADALAAGCSGVQAVTAPQNRASIAFHRRLGFEILPGSAAEGGVPFSPDYDGPGEDRVRFQLRLTALNGKMSSTSN